MAMKKYLIITLLSIFWLSVLLSCTETKKSLNIGGFEFGASKQEALVRAASLGYEIEPVGDYYLWLSGNIPALGLSWNQMRLCIDSINGLKEITLSRKYSETTPNMITKHLDSITNIFPQSHRNGYMTSFTVVGPNGIKSDEVQCDYAEIFELKDENDEYRGETYYIISQDRFETKISKKHTKTWQ